MNISFIGIMIVVEVMVVCQFGLWVLLLLYVCWGGQVLGSLVCDGVIEVEDGLEVGLRELVIDGRVLGIWEVGIMGVGVFKGVLMGINLIQLIRIIFVRKRKVFKVVEKFQVSFTQRWSRWCGDWWIELRLWMLLTVLMWGSRYVEIMSVKRCIVISTVVQVLKVISRFGGYSWSFFSCIFIMVICGDKREWIECL